MAILFNFRCGRADICMSGVLAWRPHLPLENPAAKNAAEVSMTGTGSNRRRADRAVMMKAVVVRLVDELGKVSAVSAHITNLSTTGVGVELARPIAPGKLFELTISGAAGVATTLVYRSERCKPLGGSRFFVGASFVRASEVKRADGSAAGADDAVNRIRAAILDN
jgi:hypothetical protein